MKEKCKKQRRLNQRLMFNGMNNNNYDDGFSNENQRKFHKITRMIKIGNVIATVILMVFIIRYLLGVN